MMVGHVRWRPDRPRGRGAVGLGQTAAADRLPGGGVPVGFPQVDSTVQGNTIFFRFKGMMLQ